MPPKPDDTKRWPFKSPFSGMPSFISGVENGVESAVDDPLRAYVHPAAAVICP
jgi:hypothetical protein